MTGPTKAGNAARPHESRPVTWSQKSAEQFYRALAEIALADEANEWARKRAAVALYVITDPPPEEALELGRVLARKYGW